jgi:hypothetical protein
VCSLIIGSSGGASKKLMGGPNTILLDFNNQFIIHAWLCCHSNLSKGKGSAGGAEEPYST